MLRLFTLINGKEIIGTERESTSDYVVLKEPVILQPVPQGENYGIGIYPYSPADPTGSHRFNHSLIVSESLNIPNDVEQLYVKHTSSIQIVSSIK